ncbi:undecaprenyl diphosphate synthase family protein [Clostridium rectalis]|uniref:undecaprenyl diphosphate synthase family protein n=1 Tax=Clostridium rectalis TaxID=2040295 RepID=UPI000F638845|nr:undecaprenyl diphosphate synthase family protein [Clostridium rectalis]
MKNISFKRLPKHIGIIPDGNRRWAQKQGFEKKNGYKYGIEPGVQLFDTCSKLGIDELTFYGFTKDNCKRPSEQTEEFRKACVESVMKLTEKNCEILVVGDTSSPLFPKELVPFTTRKIFGKGGTKANFLINYGWQWDIFKYKKNQVDNKKLTNNIASADISRIDLIIRWGSRRRLSGFLPIQSVYSDFYIVKELWPEFNMEQLYEALKWYDNQDVTLGG